MIRFVTVAVLIAIAYALGMMTGYVIGYNDDYKIEVIKYRRGR